VQPAAFSVFFRMHFDEQVLRDCVNSTTSYAEMDTSIEAVVTPAMAIGSATEQRIWSLGIYLGF
jgi:hypothetical protein